MNSLPFHFLKSKASNAEPDPAGEAVIEGKIWDKKPLAKSLSTTNAKPYTYCISLNECTEKLIMDYNNGILDNYKDIQNRNIFLFAINDYSFVYYNDNGIFQFKNIALLEIVECLDSNIPLTLVKQTKFAKGLCAEYTIGLGNIINHKLWKLLFASYQSLVVDPCGKCPMVLCRNKVLVRKQWPKEEDFLKSHDIADCQVVYDAYCSCGYQNERKNKSGEPGCSYAVSFGFSLPSGLPVLEQTDISGCKRKYLDIRTIELTKKGAAITIWICHKSDRCVHPATKLKMQRSTADKVTTENVQTKTFGPTASLLQNFTTIPNVEEASRMSTTSSRSTNLSRREHKADTLENLLSLQSLNSDSIRYGTTEGDHITFLIYTKQQEQLASILMKDQFAFIDMTKTVKRNSSNLVTKKAKNLLAEVACARDRELAIARDIEEEEALNELDDQEYKKYLNSCNTHESLATEKVAQEEEHHSTLPATDPTYTPYSIYCGVPSPLPETPIFGIAELLTSIPTAATLMTMFTYLLKGSFTPLGWIVDCSLVLLNALINSYTPFRTKKAYFIARTQVYFGGFTTPYTMQWATQKVCWISWCLYHFKRARKDWVWYKLSGIKYAYLRKKFKYSLLWFCNAMYSATNLWCSILFALHMCWFYSSRTLSIDKLGRVSYSKDSEVTNRVFSSISWQDPDLLREFKKRLQREANEIDFEIICKYVAMKDKAGNTSYKYVLSLQFGDSITGLLRHLSMEKRAHVPVTEKEFDDFSKIFSRNSIWVELPDNFEMPKNGKKHVVIENPLYSMMLIRYVLLFVLPYIVLWVECTNSTRHVRVATAIEIFNNEIKNSLLRGLPHNGILDYLTSRLTLISQKVNHLYFNWNKLNSLEKEKNKIVNNGFPLPKWGSKQTKRKVPAKKENNMLLMIQDRMELEALNESIHTPEIFSKKKEDLEVFHPPSSNHALLFSALYKFYQESIYASLKDFHTNLGPTFSISIPFSHLSAMLLKDANKRSFPPPTSLPAVLSLITILKERKSMASNSPYLNNDYALECSTECNVTPVEAVPNNERPLKRQKTLKRFDSYCLLNDSF